MTSELACIHHVLIGMSLFSSAAAIGIGGFGFNLLSVALLTFILPVKFVVPFSMNYSVVLNTALFATCYRNINMDDIKRLMPAMIVGVIIGVSFVSGFHEEIVKRLLGSIIALYCILSLTPFFRSLWHIDNKRWTAVFGLVAGSLAGSFGIGGPAIAAYVSGRRMETGQARSLLLASAMFMQALAIPLYAVSGMINKDILWSNVMYLPFVVAGVFGGNRIFRKLKTQIFHRVVLVILFVQAMILLIKN